MQELHREDARPQRVLWEIYCGHSRTSQLAETMGMTVERFSLDNGWDFNLQDHQRQLLAKQQKEDA